MTNNIHDATFKQILSHEQHFIDFCKAYLADDIKAKINWQTLKLHKLNQEFIDHTQNEQQKHIADVVYAVNYRHSNTDRECLILVHSEHQTLPDKLLALRLLHYKAAMLLDYAKTHPKKSLPVVISIVYYHGKITPYPYSLDIYDLFEDQKQAQIHLLNPKLVDLKQLPDQELQQHGTMTPVEVLMKRAFIEALERKDFDLFYEALIEYKDNETVLKTLKVMLYYATSALKYDRQQFLDDFISKLPELEGEMQTMAQQWKQEGRQEVVIDMIKNGADIEFVVKYSGLSRETIEELYAKHKRSSDHY